MRRRTWKEVEVRAWEPAGTWEGRERLSCWFFNIFLPFYSTEFTHTVDCFWPKKQRKDGALHEHELVLHRHVIRIEGDPLGGLLLIISIWNSPRWSRTVVQISRRETKWNGFLYPSSGAESTFNFSTCLSLVHWRCPKMCSLPNLCLPIWSLSSSRLSFWPLPNRLTSDSSLVIVLCISSNLFLSWSNFQLALL